MSVSQGKHVGYVAQLWKVVTVNGVEESREVFNTVSYTHLDVYKRQGYDRFLKERTVKSDERN